MKIIMTINTNIKECQHCAESFIFQRRSAKYCSHSCRQMAFITRKAFLPQAVRLVEKQNPALNNVAKKKRRMH